MSKKRVEVFVVTNIEKIDPNKLQKKPYIGIHAGSDFSDEKLGYLSDNYGDNISSKNNNYCELTALYWIWKNRPDAQIVGITHYRRFFYKYNVFLNIQRVLNERDILNYLDKYDILIPNKEYFSGLTVEEQYERSHISTNNLIVCRNIIKVKYPDYLSSFDKVMKRKYMYCYNMFIAKKEIFDQYMEWLFSILFEAEQKIDLSTYKDLSEEERKYQERVYGFLAERLFNVWLCKNSKFKCKEIMILESKKNKDTGEWEDIGITRKSFIKKAITDMKLGGNYNLSYKSVNILQSAKQRRKKLVERITSNKPTIQLIEPNGTTKIRDREDVNTMK